MVTAVRRASSQNMTHDRGIVISCIKAIRLWKLRFAFIDVYEHNAKLSTHSLAACVAAPFTSIMIILVQVDLGPSRSNTFVDFECI